MYPRYERMFIPQTTSAPPFVNAPMNGNFLSKLFSNIQSSFQGAPLPFSAKGKSMFYNVPSFSQPFPAVAPTHAMMPTLTGFPQGAGVVSQFFQGGGLANVLSMIQNTQKVIGIVQSVAPIVQQYGPLLKSVPQLYQILTTTNEANTDKEQASDENIDGQKEKKTVNKKTEHTPERTAKPKLYV